MTTSKQVWMASAALLLGTAAAQAADLPFRKAAPVEYVRICDAFGEGFFYIPGTDTCIRVTGQVRAEYTFRTNAPTNNPLTFAYNQAGQVYRRDLTALRARGYLNVDAKTQTAYGTLRTYVSLRSTQETTSAFSPVGGRGAAGFAGGPAPAGARFSTGFFQGYNPNAAVTLIDKAFIQFAGITAGRTNSFFDFDAQSYELLTASLANSDQITELLAYTATFGGGFSATVSAEEAAERRIGDNGTFTFSANNVFSPAAANLAVSSINSPLINLVTGVRTAGVLAFAGERLPDLVANVRYDAAWGSAQISGAYHDLNSLPVAALTGTALANFVQGTTSSPTAAGFAALAGVKILLPSLAQGDNLTLQGEYTSGAMDYFNSQNYTNGDGGVYHDSLTGLGTNNSIPVNDAFVITRPNGTTAIATAKAYGGFLAFRHYFIPTVYGTLFGDYAQIDNPTQAQRLGAAYDSARVYQVGGNLVWTPVKDFQIGAESVYTNLLYASNANSLFFGNGGAVAPGVIGSVGSGTTVRNPDDIRTRLSLRRAF